MRRRRFLHVVTMAAAVLAVWHGMLLSLPHTHADRDVPRYAADCSVAFPGSGQYHLHRIPGAVPAHGCLACLAAGTAPVLPQGLLLPFTEAGPAPGPEAPHLPAAVRRMVVLRLRAPPVRS